MGDGFSAIIASTTTEQLSSYLKLNAIPNRKWRNGPVIEHDKEIIDFLTDWMRVHKVDQSIRDKFDLECLFRNSDAYFWSEKRHSSTGFVSDGQIWIIDPKNNIIVMLNENT